MIITVSPLLGLPSGPFSWGAPVTLCSGSDTQGPEDWAVNDQPLTEVVPLLPPVGVSSPAPSFQKIIDRGNRLNSISFKITYENADVLAAQSRSLLLSAALPGRGLVKFVPDAAGLVGAAVYYGVGSVVFNMTQIGIATIESFKIVCGAITTTIPTPLP